MFREIISYDTLVLEQLATQKWTKMFGEQMDFFLHIPSIMVLFFFN